MEVGKGYWIKTDQAAQTVHIEEDFNTEVDIPLVSDGAGRYNLVGHRYWYDEAWDDVFPQFVEVTLHGEEAQFDDLGALGAFCFQRLNGFIKGDELLAGCIQCEFDLLEVDSLEGTAPLQPSLISCSID